MKQLKVLVACETSGTVREAYRKARQWFIEDNPEYKNFVRYMEIF